MAESIMNMWVKIGKKIGKKRKDKQILLMIIMTECITNIKIIILK